MPSADKKELAEKIVKILESAATNPDLASLFASIEKINHRLDKLEAIQQPSRPFVPAASPVHPSLEKFKVAEAADGVEFGARSNEKTCTFEPNGRPCDHCAMCSSRGF